MKTFWCCFVEGTGGFSFKHFTKKEAEEEAERLARLPGNRDRLVYVLEMISVCHVVRPEPPVEWQYPLA